MPQSDDKLFESLFAISRFMRGEMTTDLKKEHLTILQLQALVLIRERGEMQMQEIADHFKVTKPTATTLLNKLDKLGLIKRGGDSRDRRVVKISLSKNGEEMFKKAVEYKRQKIHHLLGYLSVKDRQDLERIMQSLVEKLSDKLQ